MKQFFAKVTMALVAIFTLMSGVSAQTRAISGKVVDQDGVPVIGASVIVVGNSTIGTVTDLDGNYSLNVPAGANLSVSFIGYTTETVAVGNQSVINVTLHEDNEFLEETVVIGYGVQRKSDLTGSVASVRSEDLAFRSTSDAAAALQGKAAGVQVFNASGAPGKGSDIRVRGVSSNGGDGLGPLLIVDGLKVDNIQYLDPSMIESVEILKDAASAAIYGAQAGNGVILVTTKSGSKSKDGNVFYQFQIDRNTLGRNAQVMNAAEYLDWITRTGQATKETLMATGAWDGKTDTDWAKVLFDRGISTRHTFGAQGGNDRGSYYLAVTYTNQDGMVKGNKDSYKRLSAQLNADYKIKSWFTVGSNTSIERYKSQAVGEANEYFQNGSSILGALIIDPLTPEYYTSYDQIPAGMKQHIEAGDLKVYQNEDGYYYGTSKIMEGDGGNPLIFRDRANNQNEGFNVRGTIFANITPFNGLVFTSRFGYRIAQNYNSNFSEPYYVNDKIKETNYNITANSTQNYFYQWENFANYNVNIARHAIGAMAGMSYTFSDNRGVNAGLNGPDPLKGYAPNFLYISQDNGSGVKSIGGGTPNQATQISYFGRLTYTYDNRYSIQANFRADAFDSSKLSKKSRWGYFPSVSAGWTVSNEPWMEGVKDALSMNFLKFRASWGVNGNIAVLSGYKYSSTIDYNSKEYQYNPDDREVTHGSVPSGQPNPDLKWETSKQFDLGMDARFFQNRLTIGVDYFDKRTEGLLVNISPILESGIASSTINAGSVKNSGIELEAGWQDNIGDFSYGINANFSTLKNIVTYLEPTVGRQEGARFSNFWSGPSFEEGHSVWYMRALNYAGVDHETGRPLFYNKDGQKVGTDVISTNDLTDMGSTIPTYNYGITINMAWKGFDLIIFGTGAGGNVLMPCIYRVEHPRINSLKYFYENAWTPSNKDAKMPSVESTWNQVSFWSSSANIFKGDFFKIKQIQLGYTLPKSLTKKVAIDNLRIYTSLDDFFLFTKYPGFDPETNSTGAFNGGGLDKGNYPNAKRVVFGVNVSF